ncbi:MAG: Tex-like N-terminal domain-containing protein, partial [Clostridia bacterium]
MNQIIAILTEQFKLNPVHIENIIKLIDEGNTIPFIARYRKEQTGSVDDQVLRELSERLVYLRNMDKRRMEISAVIEEAGALNEELAASIADAKTLTELEDIYRPFRPKRRTRATIAQGRGLSPLAELIIAQECDEETLRAEAASFVNEENGVPDASAALSGACDILAEQFSDNAAIRAELRGLMRRTGVLKSSATTKEDTVYRMYYDFTEPVLKLQSHRILAINRGEREGFLKVSIDVADGAAIGIIYTRSARYDGKCP